MIRAWRLVKAEHVSDAFSGQGARIYGGRWNEPGTSVVYVADSLALAALEVFVHLGPASRNLEFRAIPVEFPERLVEALAEEEVPANWRQSPPPAQTMALGTAWAASGRTAVLQVPSVLVVVEHDYLLNPGHPDFRHVRVGEPRPFAFDPRMWK